MRTKEEKKIMRFDKLMDGLNEYYNNTIKAKKKKYSYNGYDTSSGCILATSPSVVDQLSEEQFKYRIEEKGDTPINILLTCAVQLGIQQGINMCVQDPLRYMDNEYLDINYLEKHHPDLIGKLLNYKNEK